jgi:uncharacterized protein
VVDVFLACLLFGGFAGVLAGLFGIGGGLVLVPFFIWLFNKQDFSEEIVMMMAVATSLATIIITAVASVAAHHHLGSILWRSVANLAPTIFVGAIFGAVIAGLMPSGALQKVFAVYLIIVGMQMAFLLTPMEGDLMQSSILLSIAGLLIGIFSAVLGIGGGTLTVPVLIKLHFPMRNAVAISSACGLPIACAGTISYAVMGWHKTGLPAGSFGYVYVPAFLGIVLTSMLMAPVGARLAHRLPTKKLKQLFSVVVFIAAYKLLQ